jgi:cytochrome c
MARELQGDVSSFRPGWPLLEFSALPETGFLSLPNLQQEITMSFRNSTPLLMSLVAAALALTVSTSASAADEEAAKALARQNNCFKCHSVSKDKDGPAYKKVAEKMKGKADAESRLIQHITSGEKAKFPDGHEEDHKIIKTDPPKDMAQIKNLVQWILAQ